MVIALFYLPIFPLNFFVPPHHQIQMEIPSPDSVPAHTSHTFYGLLPPSICCLADSDGLVAQGGDIGHRALRPW